MSKIVITADKTVRGIGFKELYQYRDLFFTLVWRDFKIRYSQTTIGILWGVLQPMMMILVLTLVFGKFLKVDTGGTPHVVFILCGLSAWSYFSFVITNSGNSIIGAGQLVKKVYFPRLVIPLSKAMLGLLDHLIYLAILAILLVVYKVVPPVQIVFLPLFILVNIIAALSVGIWLSALSIRFRDFQFIIPIIVQLGLYVTPVAYPAEFAMKHLPKWATAIYFLNPMAGIIQGFRWCVIDAAAPSGYAYLSFGIIAVIFVSGILYFRKVEYVMSDLV